MQDVVHSSVIAFMLLLVLLPCRVIASPQPSKSPGSEYRSWIKIINYIAISKRGCDPAHLSVMFNHPGEGKKELFGINALDLAAQEGAFGCVRWMVTHEYTHALTRKYLGDVQPVISSAAFSRFCSVRMIRLLVKHGANPDSEGALAGAAIEGEYGCVRELIHLGANVNKPARYYTPLMAATTHAALTDHLRILKLFLAMGANPNVWKKGWGSPLFSAVELPGPHKHCAPCVQLLLHAGADPNAIDWQGQTALLWGLRPGYVTSVGIIHTLVRHGADVNLADPKTGETPLMAAAALGQREVVDYLLRHGAERCIRDDRGRTAAEYAREAHHESLGTELACHMNP